jgi:hypothetical protein
MSLILGLHNKYILFFSVVGLFFGLAVNHTIYPVALYSVIITLLFIVFLSLYQFSVKLGNIQFLLILMITSFVVKVFSVFFFESLMLDIIGIPFISYADDYTYDITSSDILNRWNQSGFGFYNDVKYSTGFYSGYPNFSALSKMLFGDHYLVPRFLNVTFSTLTIPLFFYSTKYLNHNDQLNKIITVIFSFAPAFVVYSSLQLKETILIFFLSSLLYGTFHLFYKGVKIKSIVLVIISMCVLLFFRAAILLPFILAMILAIFVTKNKESNINYSGIKNTLGLSIVFIMFYFIWEYMYSTGVLTLTAEGYFDSRFSVRGTSESYQGTNDIGKLGIIGTLLAPLLAMLSIFLPTPIYIKLDPNSISVPYHYFPLIGYYAILPMVCVSMLYVIKNYRLNKIGVFIIIFFILYKIGQAGGKSILDSRQSLPAIYVAYLLLAYFDLSKIEINAMWNRYRILIFLIMLVVMFSVTFVRYIIRQ